MKLVSVKPSPRLIKLTAIAVVLTLVFAWLGQDNYFFQFQEVLLVFFICAAIIDFLIGKTAPELEISRDITRQLSFNHWHKIVIEIANLNAKQISFHITQHVNDYFEQESPSQLISIEVNEKSLIHFRVKALKRGPEQLGALDFRVLSPWSLWQHIWRHEVTTDVKVYPDFTRLKQHQSLKGVNNLPQTGLKLLKKRGDGIEFHQLREFRQGDSLRQIDWQATSKRLKLISKEYQEEKNQHIVVMLDAGINMSLETEHGTHFDAALNALLMLSHTVLKQGDWFSMQSFNQHERWLPAVKGAQNVSRVMNHFYDLQPDESASDYITAVNSLLGKRSKRSLVLLVTTLNDQSLTDLLPAIKRLQQHHLVALINIENVALTETIAQELKTVNEANRYCAALDLKNSYNMNLKRLSKEGVICVDSKPEHLLPYVINTYLNVKHSGLL